MKRKIVKWLCKHGHYSIAYKLSPSLACCYIAEEACELMRENYNKFVEEENRNTSHGSIFNKEESDCIKELIENQMNAFSESEDCL